MYASVPNIYFDRYTLLPICEAQTAERPPLNREFHDILKPGAPVITAFPDQGKRVDPWYTVGLLCQMLYPLIYMSSPLRGKRAAKKVPRNAIYTKFSSSGDSCIHPFPDHGQIWHDRVDQ